MRCDDARAGLSAVIDGEAPAVVADEVAAHVSDCDACARFDLSMHELRRHLRLEPTDGAPDVTTAVLARLSGPGHGNNPDRWWRSPWLRVAAAFVVGALAGAVLIGLEPGGRPRLAAADLPARVLAAQAEITSLEASIEVVERGWHADVPTRTYTGALIYEAPESLVLQLRDATTYPSPAWVPNDAALVVDGGSMWTKGVRVCPSEAQPACTPADPLIEVVTNRDPFAAAKPIPLDLVTPVESLALAGRPAAPPSRRVAGRDTVGVVGRVSQFDTMLGGLRTAGNMRQFHATDVVELWLDEERLVPLAVRVTPSDSAQRERWADARGYVDRPGTPIFELTVTELSVNGRLPQSSFPPPPAGATRRDAGFVERAVSSEHAIEPAWLPDGFEPHRTGTTGRGDAVTSIRSWTDGRAWVRIDVTSSWAGDRLFGQLGALVRRVDLGAAGTGYSSEDGRRVSIHRRDIDVVVRGSVAPRDLVRVAAGLGVTGVPVPSHWAEASTTTLRWAIQTHRWLLAPSELNGFAPPAVRVDGDTVSIAYAGAGSRGFLITQADTAGLTPPLDPDAFGVSVRGSDARYSPARGELEWVEDGRSISIRSVTLGLEELLAIAEGLA